MIPDLFEGNVYCEGGFEIHLNPFPQRLLPKESNRHDNRIPGVQSSQYIYCMGFKYAIRSDKLHFLTHTVVDWIDIFTRRELANVIVNSLNYCIEHKGLEVYVWCLMPSHLHMIAATAEGAHDNLSGVMRDFKKYTSKKAIETISEINESRKNWLMNHFQTGPDSFQLWQEGMHPVELFTKRFTDQKMDYIHNNPVEAGIVREPQDYLLSSAADYFSNRKGLVKICYIT